MQYFESPAEQSPGLSIDYFSTQLSDFSSATFQYDTKPDPYYGSIAGGDFWTGNGLASFQVFSTYIHS